MKQLYRRLYYLLNRSRFDRELADDMEFHREMAARNGNESSFGNPLKLREESRDAWGWTWIDRLGQDLRYAARTLRKSPGFTLAAVAMLAIGIGVNIAAFGFFNLLVLKPLPIQDPQTLVRIQRSAPGNFATHLPYPEMAFFREHARSLASVIAINDSDLTTDGEARRLKAQFVTGNFFDELGASLLLGRTLNDDRTTEPVVVLSQQFWQRHFGADRSVVGKTIRLNGKPIVITGVASEKFSGLSMGSPDLWAPIVHQPYFVDGSHLLTDFSGSGVRMFGRLRPGVTPKTTEDELKQLAADLRHQHPNDIWENEAPLARPTVHAKDLSGKSTRSTSEDTSDRDKMYVIVALVGSFVFLILAVACGNLGSLLLARGVAREREIEIRMAIGAGRARLIRQLFTESLLPALLGSAAGLLVGSVVLHILMRMTDAPVWLDLTPDWRVFVFAVAIGFVAAILFGLTPALQLVRQRHRATATRQFLIGAQVAGSCVLLIVAGLFVRALDRAMSAHPGFEYQQVVSISPGLASHGYSPEVARTYMDTLRNHLLGLPGIKSVSLVTVPPLGNAVETIGTEIAGHPVSIHLNRVDSQFFETMTIPLLRGRALQPGDTNAVVIGESLARLRWPNEDALGKQFSTDNGAGNLVVGVAGTARQVRRQDAGGVEAYYLADAASLPNTTMLVKTSGPPEGLLSFLSTVSPRASTAASRACSVAPTETNGNTISAPFRPSGAVAVT